MSDLLAIVLPSGLGVRFQDLTPSQADAITLAAAKELPPDGLMVELTQLQARHGLEAMIKEVTKGSCKRDDSGQFVINHPDNVWEKFNPDLPSASYNHFITSPKDHSVLKQLFIDRNLVSPSEVATIMGKMVAVTI